MKEKLVLSIFLLLLITSGLLLLIYVKEKNRSDLKVTADKKVLNEMVKNVGSGKVSDAKIIFNDFLLGSEEYAIHIPSKKSEDQQIRVLAGCSKPKISGVTVEVEVYIDKEGLINDNGLDDAQRKLKAMIVRCLVYGVLEGNLEQYNAQIDKIWTDYQHEELLSFN
jgi:hypothetical protein